MEEHVTVAAAAAAEHVAGLPEAGRLQLEERLPIRIPPTVQKVCHIDRHACSTVRVHA